ncbi:VOC family protein [Paenibacillus sp. R14(2021)]|uniref:VOC family protein n=1 Tax=Paenibacillus sp. R14(2021) TaxID=2859228 RepID=UPI001C611D89|nr:VOC family protein [Paenibacillus sp. R14(2021)]
MFERIDRVILPVMDVKRAAEWYVSELEFRIHRCRGREIDLHVHRGETLLTLTEVLPFQPRPHLHLDGHVPCFNFYTHWEDLHLDWLRERGVRTSEVMLDPHMNVAEMEDPDGNVIGICHEKAGSLYHTPHEGPLPPMFHRVLAVFLPVRDLESSIAWYVGMLSFKLHHHWGQGADLTVGGGETIVTMIAMSEEVHCRTIAGMSDIPYYSLQSDRIHETYRKLQERSVTADECSEQDGIVQFHVRSPEGLLIRISEKEAVNVEQPR